MTAHLSGVTGVARALARRVPWRSRWLELSALILLAVVLVSCFDRPWDRPPMLAPLLAIPPALAGIGARSVRRPLAYGAVSLLAAVAVAGKPTEYEGRLPGVTVVTVAVITAVAVASTAASLRQSRRMAAVRSVAEVAQRALLRPPPAHLGPLGFDVVYLAAAAEAKVGGDLYEAIATRDHGIRMIMGDVRGKGLGAVELAADVLGMFRDLAHDAATLGELAAHLDAGLGRDLGRHEEFVTAVLVEVDPDTGATSVFNCGHPAPLLISAPGTVRKAGCAVTPVEVAVPASPLGLLTLGDCSGAELSFDLGPDDQLLLYTDGVTEARDAQRAFYPLPERLAVLAPKAVSPPAGRPSLRLAVRPPAEDSADSGPGLLGLIQADLVRHVGAPLNDDAALLLVRAPAIWPAPRAASAVAMPSAASA